MALHRLTSVTIGVPNVDETGRLLPASSGSPTTATAGSPPVTAAASSASSPRPTRRLVELRIGVDDADDLDRAASRLRRLGIDTVTTWPPGR